MHGTVQLRSAKNAVLKDTSLLERKFKDTCQAIILLWKELDVPYQEQSYVANHFFTVMSVPHELHSNCDALHFSTIHKVKSLNHPNFD